MTRPRPRFGSELLPLVLIFLCLGGTLALVIEIHRRGAATRKPAPEAPKVVAPAPPAALQLAPEPEVEPPSAPPVEDPTKKALGQLAAAIATEREEAAKADRRAVALETARREANARSERWRRRETLVHAQIAELEQVAERTRADLEAVALERDVLLQERDAAKAKLAKAGSASSYAILPHKGPNGTWRRPIVVECRNGAAIIQPGGDAFGMLELSALSGLRNNPFIRAVAREIVRISGQSAADGGASVPYIFFVIRPDGIRPYYEARARLEMLGIAFGYELVNQDWEIDFSELENPPGTDPLDPRPPSRPAAVAEREELTWPGERPSPKRRDDPLDAFVWHSRPTGAPSGGGAIGPAGERRFGGGSGAVPGRGLAGSASGRPADASELPRGAGGASGASGDRNGRGGLAADLSDGPGGALGGLANGAGPRLGGGPSGGGASFSPLSGVWEGEAPAEPPPSASLRAGSTGASPSRGERNGFGPSGERKGRGGLAGTKPGDTDTPLGISGGLSATERAFGAPGSVSPVVPGGVPSFESTGNAGGGGALARNDGPAPWGGAVRGRAGVGVGTQGGGPADDIDEPPQDGRVPVIPRGYFDDDDDDGPSGGVKSSAGGGRGATGSDDQESRPSAPVAGSSNSRSGGGTPSGGLGSPGGGSGAAPASRRRGSQLAEATPLRIEVPFEMTVVCSRAGVLIHPGGYRLSPSALKSKDQLMIKELKAVLQQRREVDPQIVPQPRLKFLVEPGGAQSYEAARKQTALAGLSWPTTIQVGDTKVISFSGREATR